VLRCIYIQYMSIFIGSLLHGKPENIDFFACIKRCKRKIICEEMKTKLGT
jgi:hypothetical protein